MGTYTTVVVRLTLKANTPSEIVNLVRMMVQDKSDDWQNIRQLRDSVVPTAMHEFFCNDRWYCLFSDFTGEEFCRRVWTDPLTLDCISSIKNYDNLVEQFRSWIIQYVDYTKSALILTVSEERDYSDNSAAFNYLSYNINPNEMKAVFDELDLGPTILYDKDGDRDPYYSTNKSRISEVNRPLGPLAITNAVKDRTKQLKQKRKIAKQSRRRNRK